MSSAAAFSADTLSLTGSWRFALDRDAAGLSQSWFTKQLPDSIQLPGNLPAQSIGDAITTETKWIGSIFDPAYYTAPEYARYRQPGNIKIPFFLQPEKYYAGCAWYQRDFTLPANWSGRRVVLTLERPHWVTHVWLDGRLIGENDSLSTPHSYVLGDALSLGEHVLTILVDNRYAHDIGINSHSITDHTQGNWNGIVGRIELSSTATSWIDQLDVYPHAASRTLEIKGRIGGADKLPSGTVVSLQTSTGAQTSAAIDKKGNIHAALTLAPDTALWDEFNPALHTLTATLPNGEARLVSFGLRDLATEGTHFTLNGKKIFLRGTLECAIFPKTGHPPTDVDAWKRILRIARSHGLNHLRFHSWCPPEAAFIAGDQMGFYFQIETASWPNQGSTVGDGHDGDAWLVREADRILRAYGNHPCFLFMAAGNEPDGKHSHAWLTYWVERLKAFDSRRLYTCTAGWPELPANQYHVTHPPRMHQWLDNLKSRINALPPETQTDYREYIAKRPVPIVSHEIGQWCVYPNFREIEKYTGYLKPKNFEIFRETLAEHGMAHQADAFLRASGKLQVLCYKEEIESALRTPGMGGIQLLDLHDFPGQGTALVGVLDAFWEEKGYVSPAEYHRFAGPTVPLARLAKRVFTPTEFLDADIEVAHFGAAALKQAVTAWRLVSLAGDTLAHGQFPPRDIPLGNAIKLGSLHLSLADLPAPAQLKLIVSIEGTDAENDWDLWLYPSPASQPAASPILTVSQLDDATFRELENGAVVLLTIPPAQVAPDAQRGRIELGFSSIFWNTAWTNQQAPHTLGILCDPQHPAFAQFPTQAHSNWQWWYPVMHASALMIDSLPRELTPLVQVIDDWVTNRKLALVFEAKVGQGRLLVTSIDFSGTLDPVRQQLQLSLLNYMGSAAFQPSVALTREQLARLQSTTP